MKTFQDFLDEHTKEAELFQPESSEAGRIRCVACAHRCLLNEGQRGICKIRYVQNGKLRAPWGYVAGLALDPIEKKPFYHVLPGSGALSFGMLGCDFHCEFCQNWFSSQILRDPAAESAFEPISAEEIVALAVSKKAKTVISTYNEPLITSEWAKRIFTLAKEKGLRAGYVSNGHGTREALECLRPVTDCFKVDLKSFREPTYARLGGKLQAVLDTIRTLKEMGFWVEIVTLVVPGFNDSPQELVDIASFIASVSADIPWHVTAFHPDYKMENSHRTPVETLLQASEIGKEAGLRYVYAGNLPGAVDSLENMHCHSCDELLIKRVGFDVVENRLAGSQCPKCKTVIPGIWE